MSAVETPETIRALTDEMKAAASGQVPFTDAELDTAIESLKVLAGDESSIDWAALRQLISDVAHISHKEWPKTESAAADLHSIIKGPDDATFQKIMQRVLVDGNWPAAVEQASKRADSTLPWVVLVTGLNGIRKTSSVYQPWFKQVLKQALGDSYTESEEELPDGADSFFRQLDYMMTTLANKDFARLYQVQDIKDYAALKDAIFQRYRCSCRVLRAVLSLFGFASNVAGCCDFVAINAFVSPGRKLAETLGVLLVKEAQKKGINVMVEVLYFPSLEKWAMQPS